MANALLDVAVAIREHAEAVRNDLGQRESAQEATRSMAMRERCPDGDGGPR